MTRLKLINIACTGNRGRSPVGELIANTYLQRRGALGEYAAISSGTSVDDILQGKLSPKWMAMIVQQALDRGDIYHHCQAGQIQDALGQADAAAIQLFYGYAVSIFGQEEEHYRAEVLPELAIRGRLKTVQEQTTALPDQIAVLTMAQQNHTQAVLIHQNAGYHLAAEQPVIGQRFEMDGAQPVLISVLSAYARQDPTAEVPNAFGKDKAAYKAGIETLLRDVPMAIERLLST